MFVKETKSEKLIRAYKNLLNSDFDYFEDHFKHFYLLLTEDELLHGFLSEVSIRYPFTENHIFQLFDNRFTTPKKTFKNIEEFSSFHWHLLKYLIGKHGYDIHVRGYFGNGYNETFPNIINQLIKPIASFLEEKLNDENSISYVLKRYKRRVEWFFAKELLLKYSSADKEYEEVLDQDLKLYLFDQGLEHPISKASSASGSADIIGNINKKDAFILEVKVVDSNKGYGKNRVVSGISQAYKYALDYNKPYSYLVIFNIDEQELKFNSSTETISEIPSFKLNEVTIFCLTINLNKEKTASQIGKMKVMDINEADIWSFIQSDSH